MSWYGRQSWTIRFAVFLSLSVCVCVRGWNRRLLSSRKVKEVGKSREVGESGSRFFLSFTFLCMYTYTSLSLSPSLSVWEVSVLTTYWLTFPDFLDFLARWFTISRLSPSANSRDSVVAVIFCHGSRFTARQVHSTRRVEILGSGIGCLLLATYVQEGGDISTEGFVEDTYTFTSTARGREREGEIEKGKEGEESIKSYQPHPR